MKQRGAGSPSLIYTRRVILPEDTKNLTRLRIVAIVPATRLLRRDFYITYMLYAYAFAYWLSAALNNRSRTQKPSALSEHCATTNAVRLLAEQSLLTCLGSVVLMACSAPPPPYVVLDDKRVAATISGQVTWVGTLPSSQLDRVYRDSGLCGEEVPSEDLVISDESRGIEGVIISLEGISQGKPLPPPGNLVVENRGCRFLPSALVAISGATLSVQNLDPVMHYTHARYQTRYGPTLWNVIQLAGAEGVSKGLTTIGLMDIRCDLHPNMKAFVQVFAHPYFDKSNFDGRFELRNVPPGSYTLNAWHTRFGTRQRLVTVPESGTVTIDVPIEMK